jgi:threonyl-tRNA synthetase
LEQPKRFWKFFLTEHYAGNFPLWLAPDQVRVITLNDDEALINYAKPIVAELRTNMVRVDADFSATPFKAKISNAEQLRVTRCWSSAVATWSPVR